MGATLRDRRWTLQPTVLLLQARRENDPMAAHELACFVARTGLDEDKVVTHDLCSGPPSLAAVRSHDALMVGGSGEFYVSRRNLAGFDRLLELLAEVAAVGHPTFASCFGYQSLVVALGGEVVYDPDNTEVGTYRLDLTTEGAADELFGGLPATFAAQMGHKDRAAHHPPGIPNLARSSACPLQALRVPGQPVWASQFHPELDRRTNLDRFRHYLEGYAPHLSDAERAAALDGFAESPDSSALLRRFVDLVFG